MKFVKYILIMLLLPVIVWGQSSVPYRIRLADSTYTAQLRGKTGTRTAGLSVTGAYVTNLRSHEFIVTIPGNYDLWFDAAGGTNYSKDSQWSGTYGKYIDTKYFMDAVDADFDNAIDVIDDEAVGTAQVEDSSITLAKLSPTVQALLDGDGVAQAPDDSTIEVKGDGTVGVKNTWRDSERTARNAAISDSLEDALQYFLKPEMDETEINTVLGSIENSASTRLILYPGLYSTTSNLRVYNINKLEIIGNGAVWDMGGMSLEFYSPDSTEYVSDWLYLDLTPADVFSDALLDKDSSWIAIEDSNDWLPLEQGDLIMVADSTTESGSSFRSVTLVFSHFRDIEGQQRMYFVEPLLKSIEVAKIFYSSSWGYYIRKANIADKTLKLRDINIVNGGLNIIGFEQIVCSNITARNNIFASYSTEAGSFLSLSYYRDAIVSNQIVYDYNKSGAGYGISAGVGNTFSLSNFAFYNCRHGFTSSGHSTSAGAFSAINRCYISNGYASYSDTAAYGGMGIDSKPIDTHTNVYSIDVDDVEIHGGSTGISIRDGNLNASNVKFFNCRFAFELTASDQDTTLDYVKMDNILYKLDKYINSSGLASVGLIDDDGTTKIRLFKITNLIYDVQDIDSLGATSAFNWGSTYIDTMIIKQSEFYYDLNSADRDGIELPDYKNANAVVGLENKGVRYFECNDVFIKNAINGINKLEQGYDVVIKKSTFRACENTLKIGGEIDTTSTCWNSLLFDDNDVKISKYFVLSNNNYSHLIENMYITNNKFDLVQLFFDANGANHYLSNIVFDNNEIKNSQFYRYYLFDLEDSRLSGDFSIINNKIYGADTVKINSAIDEYADYDILFGMDGIILHDRKNTTGLLSYSPSTYESDLIKVIGNEAFNCDIDYGSINIINASNANIEIARNYFDYDSIANARAISLTDCQAKVVDNTFMCTITSTTYGFVYIAGSSSIVELEGNFMRCTRSTARGKGVEIDTCANLILGNNSHYNLYSNEFLYGEAGAASITFMRSALPYVSIGEGTLIYKIEANTTTDSLDIITATDTLRMPFREIDK